MVQVRGKLKKSSYLNKFIYCWCLLEVDLTTPAGKTTLNLNSLAMTTFVYMCREFLCLGDMVKTVGLANKGNKTLKM